MQGIISRLNEVTNEIDIKEYMIVMGGKAYEAFESVGDATTLGPPLSYPCRHATFRGIKVYVDSTIDKNDIILYKVVKRSKNELE